MNQFHKILLGISIGFCVLCFIFVGIDIGIDRKMKMDEGKLAALHAYMLSKGDKVEDIGDEKTFISAMQNEDNLKYLHQHLAATDDYFGKDFNKFKAAYQFKQPKMIDWLFEENGFVNLAGISIVVCGVTFLLFLIALVGAAIKGSGNKNLS